MSANERAVRHSRQLRLAEIGPSGQALLAKARALVVGCGGLGAPVVQYLAGAGVGHLTLVDDDVVELSNLNRQTLHRTEDVGRKKADRAQEFVLSLDEALSVQTRVERLSVHNAREVIADHHVVVDCTDGLPTKYLLNDAAVREEVALVHGAATGWTGQVLVVPAGGRPCLRCLFPQIPPPGAVPTCQQVGVLGATCGVVGSWMAGAAVRVLLGRAAEEAPAFLSLDVLRGRAQRLELTTDPSCPTCGEEWEHDARDPADYEPGRC